jgi:predicted nucleotidyltransferase
MCHDGLAMDRKRTHETAVPGGMPPGAGPTNERWLGEAVERIRAALNPHRIVQFGSQARGTATRKSDLDLLIVADTEQPPLERIGTVLRLLADSPWPVDAIVLTPAELERRSHSPFIRAVLRDGKVLYERGAA